MVNSKTGENGNNITLDESDLFCGGIKDKELVTMGGGIGVGRSCLHEYIQNRNKGGDGMLTTHRKVSPEAIFAIMYGAGDARVGVILLEESEEELLKRLNKQRSPRLQLLSDEAESVDNSDVQQY